METTNSTTRMKISRVLGLLFLFTAFLYAGNAAAQTYKPTAGSSLKVNGTSNVHDWVMEAQAVPAEVALVVEGTQVKDIKSLTLTLPVRNLKAKDDIMNTRAYKTLKEDANKNITFKMTSGSVSQNDIKVNGTLTIAGVSKPVALQAKATVNSDGTVTCTGSRKIKMSEYGITPPSFMLGAMKVGDDITINFDLKLKK